MAETISYRFVMRRALAATWTALNDVLLEGEYGYEKDTGKVKIGDGVTGWNDLDYFAGGISGLIAGTGITIDTADPANPIISADGGSGITLSGRVADYASLPTSGLTSGDAYLVDADSLVYVYDGSAFPADGDGVAVGGNGDDLAAAEGVRFFDDFVEIVPTSAGSGTSFGTARGATGFTSNGSFESGTHPDGVGVVRMYTTGSSSYPQLYLHKPTVRLTDHDVSEVRARLYITDLTGKYLYIGFRNVLTGTPTVDCGAFVPEDSPNWHVRFYDGTNTELIDTGIAAVLDEFVIVQAKVFTADNRYEVWVNGTLIGSHVSAYAMPDNLCGPHIRYQNNSGGAAHIIVDWMEAIYRKDRS